MKLRNRNTDMHSLSQQEHVSPGIIGRLTARLPKHALCGVLTGVVAGLLAVSGAQAALTYSGELNPADPSTWTTSTAAYVGQTADGSLTIDGGSTISSSSSYLGYNAGVTGTVAVSGGGSSWTSKSNRYIGYNGTGVMSITNGGVVSSSNGYLGNAAGSAGTVTVDGTGSTWNNSSNLTVANSGSGTLSITNGGAVNVTNTTTVGKLGTINFGGSNGGTLTTGSLYASPSQLSGAGTINTSGILSDMDMAFNATHGTTQTLNMNGVTVNLTQSSTKNLGAGYLGTGSLSITDGVTVASSGGYLGYGAGSAGTATVDGAGSKWTNSTLYIGYNGTGVMSITNGGVVSSSNGYLGNAAGSAGTVTVDGTGSTWNNSSNLTVANSGSGALNITNGGAVNVTNMTTVGKLGTINFGGSNGGTLTTGGLYVGASQLFGTGTINTSGIVSDVNLVFNASQGTTQSLTTNGITFNLTQSTTKDLGVGYLGSGSLAISDGVSVSSAQGYLGYYAGSTGTATIDGANSKWIGTGNFYAGYNGNGTLNVTNGGSGNFSSAVYAASQAGSTGAVNVDGAGSYIGTGAFYIGTGGTGTLAIINGGNVISGSSCQIGGGAGSLGSAIVSGAD